MDATLQDLIDRGGGRKNPRWIGEPFCWRGWEVIDCCDLNKKNFEYYWQDNKTYFCITIGGDGEGVAYNNEHLDYLEIKNGK